MGWTCHAEDRRKMDKDIPGMVPGRLQACGWPTTRWLDDIIRFIPVGDVPWESIAQNRETWAAMEEEFVAYAR